MHFFLGTLRVKFKRCCIQVSLFSFGDQSNILVENHMNIIYIYRDQARGRLGQNSRPRGRNFTLNGTQGEVGVSLKKKKKKFFFFFFFFF